MSNNEPYTQNQLDLMQRIERTSTSRELRETISEMRSERERTAQRSPEVVRGENRVVGFTRNDG